MRRDFSNDVKQSKGLSRDFLASRALTPWAAIRTARYKLERITLASESGLDGFLAAAQESVAAVGEEAGELLGFDLGL